MEAGVQIIIVVEIVTKEAVVHGDIMTWCMSVEAVEQVALATPCKVGQLWRF